MTKFKNILITGASSGIGEALALYYASHGAENLFLCGRNLQRLEAVAQNCRKNSHIKVITQIIDITDRQSVYEWINLCNRTAPLNLIFANAGISTGAETSDNIYNTFSTNVMGVVNTVLPSIEIYQNQSLSTPKAIAITSSIAGYHGLMTCPSYSASKSCVKAWGEALRLSLKPKKIQINVICPGFVRSRITDKNTCPMPFFMEAEKAAEIIASRIEKNIGLITFPWPMRFAAWFGSILPNWLSEFIYSKMPYKV
ncbi:MAG: SDR family NAD(P)-dependent oxidoreductase [Alphaproteobacteria bacterium]|nr:SDR family NAD(P)-dependent oxidoreductase [Alphaproteobacteria bacterium]